MQRIGSRRQPRPSNLTGDRPRIRLLVFGVTGGVSSCALSCAFLDWTKIIGHWSCSRSFLRCGALALLPSQGPWTRQVERHVTKAHRLSCLFSARRGVRRERTWRPVFWCAATDLKNVALQRWFNAPRLLMLLVGVARSRGISKEARCDDHHTHNRELLLPAADWMHGPRPSRPPFHPVHPAEMVLWAPNQVALPCLSLRMLLIRLFIHHPSFLPTIHAAPNNSRSARPPGGRSEG